MSAPLQRIQTIKGWIDADGKTQEKVRDIACTDGLEVDPTTLRCPDNGASVDLTTCKPTADTAAMQLSKAWKDPDFDPTQGARSVASLSRSEPPTLRFEDRSKRKK